MLRDGGTSSRAVLLSESPPSGNSPSAVGSRSAENRVANGSGSRNRSNAPTASTTAAQTSSDGIELACYAMYPLLTPSQVTETKKLFDHYVNISAAAHESALGDERAGSTTDGSKERDGSALSLPTGFLKDSCEQQLLKDVGLFEFFSDLGIHKTIYEVRDLIEAMNQSPAVLRSNAEKKIARSCCIHGMSQSDGRGGNPVSPTSSDASSKYVVRGLSFALFLHLMCSLDDTPAKQRGHTSNADSDHPLTEPSPMKASAKSGRPRDEQQHGPRDAAAQAHNDGKERHSADISAMFRIMDADRDGALSVSDIRSSVKELLRSGLVSDDLRQLSRMSTLELRIAMHEVDLDGDGIVTLRDLERVLQTM